MYVCVRLLAQARRISSLLTRLIRANLAQLYESKVERFKFRCSSRHRASGSDRQSWESEAEARQAWEEHERDSGWQTPRASPRARSYLRSTTMTSSIGPAITDARTPGQVA